MVMRLVLFCDFRQKTAYEVRMSDWSSDVCSSDLPFRRGRAPTGEEPVGTGRVQLKWVASNALPVRLARAIRHVPRDQLAAPAQHGRASCRERVCQYV